MKHKTVMGITGSGKTYKMFKEIKEEGIPTIFYNIKDQPIELFKKNEYITLRGGDKTLRLLSHGLKHYKMINYIPSDEEKGRQAELEKIVKWMFKQKQFKKLHIAVDEAWEVTKQGKDHPLFTISRRGRSEGLKITFLTQSVAEVDKRGIRQCEIIDIGFINKWEYKYLKNIGLPADEIEKRLTNAPEYSFVRLQGGNLSGPFVA